MNDLSLFNSNQKATSKEVVTTKQLAETLGVDVRTVQRAAEKNRVRQYCHTLENCRRCSKYESF